MRRILFQWGGIKIYAYPTMLYFGLVFGVLSGTYLATLHGLDPKHVYIATLILIPPALMGARLLFVVSHWELYRRDLSKIWRRSEGGAALYGGLLVSFLFSLPLLNALKVSIAAFWDTAAVAILVGMIPTKIGCLLNGCCAGRPTDGSLGLYLPNERGLWRRRLPSQPLEAVLAISLLIASISAWRWFPFDGVLFFTALAGYGLGRWWLESTRETVDTVGSLNLHRTISGALVAISCVGLLIIWLNPPAANPVSRKILSRQSQREVSNE